MYEYLCIRVIKWLMPLCIQLFQLRWLSEFFRGGYLPSLSINYVGTSKDMGKRLPQLYYIKMKISLIGILLQSESPWPRNDAITFFFIYLCVSLYQESFFKKSLKGVCTCHNCLNYGKVWTNSMRAFRNILKRSFKHHKNSEIASYPHN